MKPVTGRPNIANGPAVPAPIVSAPQPRFDWVLVPAETRPTPVACGPTKSRRAQPFWNVSVIEIDVVLREPRTPEFASVGMWPAPLRIEMTVDSQQIEFGAPAAGSGEKSIPPAAAPRSSRSK